MTIAEGMQLNKSDSDVVLRLLKEFQASSADVEGAMIVSGDGIVFASTWPQIIDDEQIAAFLAASVSAGSMLLNAFSHLRQDHVYFEYERGYVIVAPLVNEYFLAVLVRANAKLGLIFLDIGSMFLSRSFEAIFRWRPPGHLSAGADFD